ncbi:hypothetical protein DL768_008420 [Monosporascus sp. mg162]|nr:hypothetical protein DL768_008420 [Monosporascus sp. mg162]
MFLNVSTNITSSAPVIGRRPVRDQDGCSYETSGFFNPCPKSSVLNAHVLPRFENLQISSESDNNGGHSYASDYYSYNFEPCRLRLQTRAASFGDMDAAEELWRKRQSTVEHPSETTPSTISKRLLGAAEWIRRLRKGDLPRHPGIPEMETGENVYKYFSGGAWRTELYGNPSRNPSDGPHIDPHSVRAELHNNHLRNTSDYPQVDPTVSDYPGSKVINPIPTELEASMPRSQPPVFEEAGEKAQQAPGAGA